MFAALLTPFLVFAAFLLLLLVSLSVPIIKTIYLFRLNGAVATRLLQASASGSARFGVWGYCVSSIDISILGLNHDSAANCSRAALGYDFGSDVANALHVSGPEDSISHTLSMVLVLHPVACGLAFLTLLCALALTRPRRTARRAAFLTLGIGLLAALVTTAIFLVDVVFVAIARSRVKRESAGVLALTWGNAVWMTLGATVAIWAALVGTCISLVRRRARFATERS